MNTWKSLGSFFVKGLLCVSLIAPAVTSCYDDAALWAELEEINTKLNDLETSLNGQIEALNNLLAGGDITISECEENEDGSYDVTLSNGTTFSVFSKKDTQNGLVSVIDINGVRYWAAYNAEGKLAPVKDDAGKNIPVTAVLPTVEKRDGVYYLLIEGKEYVTGHEENVTVITDYVINKDDSGNIYSATFTFGDEALTFTIPMNNYKGFSYILGSSQAGGKVIKDLYVSHGATYRIATRLDGVVDYVMQVPAGWKVDEKQDATELYLDVTAPSAEAVAAGSAVADGDLKAVAVLEDGKAMIAKLHLTTEPFKTFTATSTHAIIEKYNGVDKYLYGLTKFMDFDEDAVFANAEALLKANDEGVAAGDLNVTLESLLGETVVPETSYVLWAIPAFFDQNDDEAVPFVKEGLIKKHIFGGSAVKLLVTEELFNDASVTFSAAGITSYFAGTVLKTDTTIEDILYKVNNEIVTPVSGPMNYNGSAFQFPNKDANESVKPVSETTYVSWVIPVSEGGAYTADNIISKEFTLKGVTAGGSTVVKTSAATVDRVSIKVPVASENATRIYYAFLTKNQAGRVSATKRADYLLRNGKLIDAAEAELLAEELEPDSEYTLFAMSTDRDGKYGEVTVDSYTTDDLVYNSLSVSVQVSDISNTMAKATVTVTDGDATEYLYWIGHEADPFWVNNGKSPEGLQKRIVLYPESSEVQRSMYNNPIENGVINMSDLKPNAVHYIVVLAKDSSDNYSVAGYAPFTTLSVNLGTVVRKGDTKWETAKGQIDIQWNQNSFRSAESSGMFAYYSFKIKCPTDYTAYILCMSDLYFDDQTFPTMDDRIIEIEAQASRKYDASRVIYDENGNYAEEPDWVDDNGETHDGTLLNVYTFYVHGYPLNGFATYFAAGTHGADNCTSWKSGDCYNYTRAVESITKRHSVDFYKQVVKDVRGNSCKTEATINKVAQDLFEAYYSYYKDAEPAIFINNGEYLEMSMPNASGLDEDGNVVDDVYVVLKDAQGNYYEPMSFEVPNYFE